MSSNGSSGERFGFRYGGGRGEGREVNGTFTHCLSVGCKR